jgi:hypothetical protein
MADLRHARGLAQALILLLATPLLLAPLAAPPTAAQEAEMPAPDFSGITTKAAARKLVRAGELVEILYFPAEFGGPDEPQNVGYVTPEAAYVRAMVIESFGRLADQGAIDRLNVVPDYKGDSIVPSRITMTGTRAGEEGSIGTTIEVW